MKKRNNGDIKRELSEGIEYLRINKLAVLAWIAVYFVPSFVSLFVAGKYINDDPVMVFGVVPRILLLMTLTLFGYLTRFGKSIFMGGFTVWSVWLLSITDNAPYLPIIAAIVGIAATIVFVFIEKNPEHEFKPNKAFTPYVIFFYAIFVLTMAVEMLSRFDIVAPVMLLIKTPDIYMTNVLVVMFTGLFVLICKRKKFAFSVFSFVWLALAFISVLKVNNVYEPLTVLDIFATADMCAVVFKYFKWFFFVLLGIGLVGVVVLLIYLAKIEKKEHVRASRVVTVVIFFVTLVITFIFLSNVSFMRFDSTLIIENYYAKGFPSSLLRYTVKSVPEKPAETQVLSAETIKKNVDKKYLGKETQPTVQNVIVIQMESFCDPDIFRQYNEGISYEYDPTPFIHELKNNFSNGFVSVPVFAGQTIKSEFEFITGVNIDTLPGGYNPYVTSLNVTPIDSLARYFKECGYGTTAIHNYQGEFFARYQVYKNLGFDTFIPVECMAECERRGTTIWAGDNILASQIEDALDANDKNFIFTVSMQLHGSYPVLEESEYTQNFKGLEANPQQRGKLAYYIKELEAFDKAIESIVKMVEKREEPTVIVFYADHLPQLARDICTGISNGDTFKTDYFIWDNIGLEKKSEDLELYKLSTLLCDKIGASGGFMNKFNRLYDDFERQKIIGYEMTFENTDFTNEDYKIGIEAPIITEIEETEDGYVLRGYKITENTVVTVNGKVYGIEYVSPNELIFKTGRKKLATGDELTLRIIGERLGNVFCESKKYCIESQIMLN